MTQSPCLPELPKPFMELNREVAPVVYQAWVDQMNAYGLACYEAGSAAAAQAAWQPIGWQFRFVFPTHASNWHTVLRLPVTDMHSGDDYRYETRLVYAAAPTQGAEGAAPQAEVDDNRTFGLTLEGKDGRQVEVRWTRSQVDELVRILLAQGLIPAPEKTAALSATIKSALGTFETICNYCDSADLAQHIVEEIGSTCDELREALTPSPTPTAPQEADALREALRRISLIEIDRDADDADEMIERGISAVGQARAALAQHQPQQGEQHGS